MSIHQSDRQMDEYIARLRRDGAHQISGAAAAASPDERRVLTMYARGTVDRAVRDNDPALLVAGCVAVAIGVANDGLYHSSIFMARMRAAAPGLGVTGDDVINEAVAELPDGGGRAFLTKWLDPVVDIVGDGSPFDPSEPEQKRFTAYGPAPFPDPRDADLDAYIESVRRAGAAEIGRAAATASHSGSSVLACYAMRTAVRAVRAHDPSGLVSGFVAVAMAAANAPDIRDVLVDMAPMDDAIGRSGGRRRRVISEAADLVDGAGREFLLHWLSRLPWQRSLKAMRYEAVEAEDGFRYKRTW